MTRYKTAELPRLKDVHIDSGFWGFYKDIVKNSVIPYQWKALNDQIEGAEPSHCIENFRLAAQKNKQGYITSDFYGMVFQDSDLAKWLEAVAYFIAENPDDQLEKTADKMIELIGEAQEVDGYLDTYFTVKKPDQKWTNLRDDHELYCAGHLIEAAVAYYEATGKRRFLDIMEKNVRHIRTVLGSENGKKPGYPGHPEIELALIRLYHATDNSEYLDLAEYFIRERGQEPHYFLTEAELREDDKYWAKGTIRPPLAYCQADQPITGQQSLRGHAVRALYLLAGVVDVAIETGAYDLLSTAHRLWESCIHKQMYLTGGVGSTHHGEAFTFEYDLPNDTVYAETCASIALIFVAQRFLRINQNSVFADIIERALYNTCIASMQMDGTRFLYVNPLTVWPEASNKDCDHWHVTPQRQKWFGCACCPPNFARLIGSLGQYAFAIQDDTLFVHLYVESSSEFTTSKGKTKIELLTKYPLDGVVNIRKTGDECKLALRIPDWCKNYELFSDGQKIDQVPDSGYVFVSCPQGDHEIRLEMEMTASRVYCNPHVPENIGRTALQRGPLVYCLEQADNGAELWRYSLPTDAEIEECYEPDLLGGVITLSVEANVIPDEDNKQLYRSSKIPESKTKIKFIPYYTWSNREIGEMMVWIREA